MVQIFTCKDGDNLEGTCCCWVESEAGNVRYGHTYTFDPVNNPVIGARLNGGPSGARDFVTTQIWVKKQGKDWINVGSAPLPRFPNNEISSGVAFAVEGTVTGVQFGNNTNPTDRSSIAVCSPFNPEKINSGEIVEISAAPGKWRQEAQDMCSTLAETGCTVNTFLRERTGAELPGTVGPFPVGDMDCLTMAFMLLSGTGVGAALSVQNIVEQGEETVEDLVPEL